jgi:hypothetical protein
MARAARPFDDDLPPVRILTHEEAIAHFDEQARHWLGMSGEEFLRRWDADEYAGRGCDDFAVEHMRFLIPIVRSMPAEVPKGNDAEEIEIMSRAATPTTDDLPPVRELTHEEAIAYFDEQARHWLGMSGEEFLQRWDAGEYAGQECDEPAIRQMAMLIPFVR